MKEKKRAVVYLHELVLLLKFLLILNYLFHGITCKGGKFVRKHLFIHDILYKHKHHIRAILQ